MAPEPEARLLAGFFVVVAACGELHESAGNFDAILAPGLFG